MDSSDDFDDQDGPYTAGHIGAQSYFKAQKGGQRTSSRNLSGISLPGHSEVVSMLRGSKWENHPICDQHPAKFALWRCQLFAGFNLLLYGFGSKKSLAEEFVDNNLLDGSLLRINGFSPTANAKQVFNTITQQIIGSYVKDVPKFSSILDQSRFIQTFFSSAYSSEQPKLYLLIHNIDGPNFRSQAVQTAFGYIAASERIHVIATVDHINAPLQWDQVNTHHFNWLWYDCTTYRPYEAEATYEIPAVGLNAEAASRGVSFVLRSLTPNHRQILAVLAEHQNSNQDRIGLVFHDFYMKCQEQMLVTNDVAMRNHLTELKDHAIVLEKKASDGKEYLYIPEDKLEATTKFCTT